MQSSLICGKWMRDELLWMKKQSGLTQAFARFAIAFSGRPVGQWSTE